ncbi:hypothetical protein F5Y18DRAFT_429703 [Xylariaceae sp. FL1019]|nr:hypothetical protein F5Y18DRAFT_429703 [Xylariaceae sp. FL1019]
MSSSEIPREFSKQYGELSEYFGGDGPRFKLEKYLGKGSNNFTLLFVEERGDDEPPSRFSTLAYLFRKKITAERHRRVVVKRSRTSAIPASLLEDTQFDDLVGNAGLMGADDMWSELSALQRFSGSKDHIVKLLPIVDNKGRQRTSHVASEGPDMIIQEYVPNGTLRHFVQAVGSNNLPESLINSIFFCLVRIAIAMAYPMEDGETIPENPTINPAEIAHCDMDWTNFMFGSTMPRTEHDPWPILKAIDFGQAREYYTAEDAREDQPRGAAQRAYTTTHGLAAHAATANAIVPGPKRRNTGVEKNILDIGQVMVQVLRGRNAEITVEQCRRWIANTNNYPALNPEIRILIIRCLAPQGQHRPSLEELVSYNWRGVAADADEAARMLAEHMFEAPLPAPDGLTIRLTLDRVANAVLTALDPAAFVYGVAKFG